MRVCRARTKAEEDINIYIYKEREREGEKVGKKGGKDFACVCGH